MKTIVLNDAQTGEQLNIQFDLEEDTMEINGEPVVRKRALEGDENQLVYSSPGSEPEKLFHLTRDQIDEMRAL